MQITFLIRVLRISFLFVCLAFTAFPNGAYAQSITFSFAQPSFTVVNQTNAVISVVVTGTPITSVSVDFATGNGTATAGVNYVATTGTLVFAVGVFTNRFNVSLFNNSIQSTQT